MSLLKRCRRGRYYAGTLDQGKTTPALPSTAASPLMLESGSSNSSSKDESTAASIAVDSSSTGGQIVEKKESSALRASSQQQQKGRVFTAADTFWRALFKEAPEEEQLPRYPPTSYYWAAAEE